MKLRLGVHNVTGERFWELFDGVPSSTVGGFEWSFEDFDVRGVSGRRVVLFGEGDDWGVHDTEELRFLGGGGDVRTVFV